MNAFQERWAELHEQLKSDYLNPDKSIACCVEVSKIVGRYLREEGASPWQYRIEGERIYGLKTPITPRPYVRRVVNGEVRSLQWTCHYVAVDDDTVYDPMLPQPTKAGDYPGVAFVEPVILSRVAITFPNSDDPTMERNVLDPMHF